MKQKYVMFIGADEIRLKKRAKELKLSEAWTIGIAIRKMLGEPKNENKH
jgi:hypothetical protein